MPRDAQHNKVRAAFLSLFLFFFLATLSEKKKPTLCRRKSSHRQRKLCLDKLHLLLFPFLFPIPPFAPFLDPFLSPWLLQT